MKRIISCVLVLIMVIGALQCGTFALEDEAQMFELYVQLGGTDGSTYNTVIDEQSRDITLALPASKAETEALKKAKITYRANGDASTETDSIYQDISSPVEFNVSKGDSTKNYTLNVELLSIQRDYNFNSATLMAANHATKERRKACGYVNNTGKGMWV